MLRLLSGFPDHVLAALASGEVTAEEYRTILAPAAEAKIKAHGTANLYYQFGPDFTGMSAGAMWEDTKLDIGHWKGWGRIAIVSDVDWIRQGARLAVLLLHRPVRVFSNAEADAARDWVAARDDAAHVEAGR
jgi:hypothetical protein